MENNPSFMTPFKDVPAQVNSDKRVESLAAQLQATEKWCEQLQRRIEQLEDAFMPPQKQA